MSNRNRSDSSSTVAGLRARMLLIIGFIESVQDFPAASDLVEFIEAEAAKGNLRALRLLSREVDGMTSTLEAHERDELQALLKVRLGVDSEGEQAELARWASSVVRRGTIRSEKERKKIETYLEMLTATGGDPALIQELTSLLQSC